MKLDPHIQKLEIFYDGKCAMCCNFQEWLNKQERANAVAFIPYQSEEVEQIFPELHKYNPSSQMVVRTDTGDIYQGAEAWVWTLWSCARYRDVAEKINNRWLLPIAKKMCHLLSANRMGVSKILFNKKAKQLAEEIHQMPGQDCDGTCDIDTTKGEEK